VATIGSLQRYILTGGGLLRAYCVEEGGKLSGQISSSRNILRKEVGGGGGGVGVWGLGGVGTI